MTSLRLRPQPDTGGTRTDVLEGDCCMRVGVGRHVLCVILKLCNGQTPGGSGVKAKIIQVKITRSEVCKAGIICEKVNFSTPGGLCVNVNLYKR